LLVNTAHGAELSELGLPTLIEDHIDCCQPNEDGEENRESVRSKNGIASPEYDDRNKRWRGEKDYFQKPKELPPKFAGG